MKGLGAEGGSKEGKKHDLSGVDGGAPSERPFNRVMLRQGVYVCVVCRLYVSVCVLTELSSLLR
jgi:predicted secreted protein